jgi:hypothetical protein
MFYYFAMEEGGITNEREARAIYYCGGRRVPKSTCPVFVCARSICPITAARNLRHQRSQADLARFTTVSFVLFH